MFQLHCTPCMSLCALHMPSASNLQRLTQQHKAHTHIHAHRLKCKTRLRVSICWCVYYSFQVSLDCACCILQSFKLLCGLRFKTFQYKNHLKREETVRKTLRVAADETVESGWSPRIAAAINNEYLG